MFHRTKYTRKNIRQQYGGASIPLAALRFSDSQEATPVRFPKWIQALGNHTPLFSSSGNVSFEQYISCIQQQDVLFKTAVQLSRQEIGIRDEATEDEILDFYIAHVDSSDNFHTWQTHIQTYIADVLELVTLNGRAGRQDLSKDWDILKKTQMGGEPLPFLLLPTNIDNICIQSIVQIFHSLKDESVLQRIRTIPTDETGETISASLTKLLARKYDSFSKGLSLSVRGADLIGFLYPGQTIRDFQSILAPSFWEIFLEEVVAQNGMDTYIRGTNKEWAILTAHIYNEYAKTPSGESVLRRIVQSLTQGNMELPVPRSPLDPYLQTNIPGTSVTLESVLRKMSVSHFQFLLHLVYTLETERLQHFENTVPGSQDTGSTSTRLKNSYIPV
jgi:hypothetical protein